MIQTWKKLIATMLILFIVAGTASGFTENVWRVQVTANGQWFGELRQCGNTKHVEGTGTKLFWINDTADCVTVSARGDNI